VLFGLYCFRSRLIRRLLLRARDPEALALNLFRVISRQTAQQKTPLIAVFYAPERAVRRADSLNGLLQDSAFQPDRPEKKIKKNGSFS
jgi:hypothetical protein